MRCLEAKLCFLLLVLGALGCEEGFEPASRVTSLRVLAVQPEPASGAPGQPVHLSMLLHDGRASFDDVPAPPEPTVLWIGGCHNPPSRQFFGCYAAIRALAGQLAAASGDGTDPDLEPVPGLIGMGRDFDFTIPENILEDAPRYDTDPIHYGVSYVFFAACAGQLRIVPDSEGNLPLGCFDPESGDRLGARDYVEGFTTVFTYEGSTNHNPELTGIRFAGVEVNQACSNDSDCEDLASASPLIDEYICGDAERCVPVVERCDPGGNDDSCPEYDVEPLVDRESAELDPTAPQGSREILWLNFFADAGSFQNETRLLNDRETGWIDNHENRWRPIRRAPGTVQLFTTVHDNRGGAAWGRFEVLLKDR